MSKNENHRVGGRVLERNKRLSASLLWELQRRFFHESGMGAWSGGAVPHYITSNPFTANAYAKIALGFIKDCMNAKINKDPFYIIELGSGSGRFAFHFMKKFFDLKSHSSLEDLPVRYIMTDFAKSNVEAWQNHPLLKQFSDSGLLDFAEFDAQKDKSLNLLKSGATLCSQTVKDPVAVIANYVFDSIPADAFYIKDGVLYESLVTLSSENKKIAKDDPAILKDIRLSYEQKETSADYYPDPDLNDILKSYVNQLNETFLLFPHCAMQCIKNLQNISKNGALLLSGDKGYSLPDALLNRPAPRIKVHGCFSLMVNYHAMGEYVKNKGGMALHTSYPHKSLNVNAFLTGSHPENHPETRMAFYEAVEQGGPDDFFHVKKGVEKHYQGMTLPQILSYLRISGWDANIFAGCFPTMLGLAKNAALKEQRELYQAMLNVWDNYYPMGEKTDVAFCLGMLLYEIDCIEEAAACFQHSIRNHGPEPETLYNAGICRYKLGFEDGAKEYIEAAVAANPSLEAGLDMLKTIGGESASF